jgi:LysR family hydrogen peroxide-inducible transcriptional activator
MVIMILPNLKHLQYLVLLHEHQHFHRAAEAAFVSQSTLSSAILKLEEQFSCQLIERDNKSFIFTVQGEQIVKRAKAILLDAQEMADYANQQADPLAGDICIGCIPTIAPFLLPELTKLCQQQLPKLSLYYVEDNTDQLLSKLENGEIDIALLAFPVKKHSFTGHIVGKDAFYVSGNAELVAKFSEKMDYSVLPNQSVFLLTDEHCLSEHAITACKLSDKRCLNTFTPKSISTLIEMTKFHQGITFLPEMAIKQGIAEHSGIITNKLSGDVYREIGLLWRGTSMKTVTFNKIAEILTRMLN